MALSGERPDQFQQEFAGAFGPHGQHTGAGFRIRVQFLRQVRMTFGEFSFHEIRPGIPVRLDAPGLDHPLAGGFERWDVRIKFELPDEGSFAAAAARI